MRVSRYVGNDFVFTNLAVECSAYQSKHLGVTAAINSRDLNMSKDQEPKKFTSKFFRVATEGATTDGRHIERVWIQQMADNYSQTKYGARVWIEHIRGISPDSSFRAYGDVIALEAREVEDGKLALFAKIDPTPELVELSRSRQKIYTSIEINHKFADTGEAYLEGLAVTDSPASLGTEILKFARQNPEASPFAARKQNTENVFSAAVETDIEFSEHDDGESFLSRVRTAFNKFSQPDRQAATSDREDFARAIEEMAELFGKTQSEMEVRLSKVETNCASLLEKIETDIQALSERIDTTPGHHTERPAATGSTGQVLTDV